MSERYGPNDAQRAIWNAVEADDVNGGEWYQDGQYVRNHRRQVALAHCQDEQIAEQIVRDHAAASAEREALAAEVGRLRRIETAAQNLDRALHTVRIHATHPGLLGVLTDMIEALAAPPATTEAPDG